MAYFEICNLAKSGAWTQHTDDTGNVYMHNAENGHWVGYDTPQTVERKVKYKEYFKALGMINLLMK